MSLVSTASWRDRYPSVGYIAPFVSVLVLLMLPKPQSLVYWEWPVSVLVVAIVCWFTWPVGASLRVSNWVPSLGVGIGVFLLWIAPEAINPHYRSGVLFSNGIVGHVGSSLRPEALRSSWVLAWRTIRASTVVPIAEELFWRAWLMRWLINNDFQKIALGTYAAAAFWITAALFGAEHGPYWDVGLLCGIIYNWWMIRTKSLGDCVLVHATTNLLLSLYVIAYGQWQYWQ